MFVYYCPAESIDIGGSIGGIGQLAPWSCPIPLTDTSLRATKPRWKAYRLFDEKGLYIEIPPAGGKWWRQKYRYGGKEKRLSFGTYPEVSLREARSRRDEARSLLSAGVDPSAHRKAMKTGRAQQAANSFQIICREWFQKFSPLMGSQTC